MTWDVTINKYINKFKVARSLSPGLAWWFHTSRDLGSTSMSITSYPRWLLEHQPLNHHSKQPERKKEQRAVHYSLGFPGSPHSISSYILLAKTLLHGHADRDCPCSAVRYPGFTGNSWNTAALARYSAGLCRWNMSCCFSQGCSWSPDTCICGGNIRLWQWGDEI